MRQLDTWSLDDFEFEGELQALRASMMDHFQNGRWPELARALEGVATMGEHAGQMELCLRAQSLRELMGLRAGGRGAAGKRVEELFHELMFHLSHFQWLSQASH